MRDRPDQDKVQTVGLSALEGTRGAACQRQRSPPQSQESSRHAGATLLPAALPRDRRSINSTSQSLHFSPAQSLYAQVYEVWIQSESPLCLKLYSQLSPVFYQMYIGTVWGFCSVSKQTTHYGLTKRAINIKYYKPLNKREKKKKKEKA